MEFNKSNFFGIIGIAIGIFGVVGPIAWDYYKTKSEIELKVIESSVIIEKPKKLDGLVISYGGEELDELSKTTFSLSNTGRTPLLKKDVVQPIHVRFSPESRIIDAKIEATNPKDMGATIQFNRADGYIVFDIPLLNPGDQIEVSALSKSIKVDFHVTARIAGVTSLNVVKEIAKPRGPTPWTIYPVGFFSALLLLASVVGLSEVSAEIKTKKSLRAGTLDLPQMHSLAECLAWIDAQFFFTTKTERRVLKSFVETLSDRADFSSAYRNEILGGVQRLVDNAVPNLSISIMFIVISGLGGWYVFTNV